MRQGARDIPREGNMASYTWQLTDLLHICPKLVALPVSYGTICGTLAPGGVPAPFARNGDLRVGVPRSSVACKKPVVDSLRLDLAQLSSAALSPRC
jgi:hypothetical protein